MTNPKVLVIDRSRWVRGSDAARFGASQLLNERGFQCCLGFDAEACGVPRDALDGVSEPGDLDQQLLWSAYRNTRVRDDEGCQPRAIGDAIQANDDSSITDTEREALLIPILKCLGWDDVRFVDGAPV